MEEESTNQPTNDLDVNSLVKTYASQLPLSDWLKIYVKEPTKRTNTTLKIQDTYVVYMIETKIHDRSRIASVWLGDDQDSATFPDTLTIWRRYSEFDLLRDYLLVMYPSVVVPPLPEKRTTGAWQVAVVDKLDPEFIERRRGGLEQFMRRLCELVDVSQDPIVLAFLKNDENWKDTVYATNYQAKAESRIKSLSASYRIKKPNSKFEAVRKFASLLESEVSGVLKARAKTTEHLYGIHKIHANYGREFSEWSSLEKSDLAEGLQKMGHYIDSFAQDIDISIENEEDFADQLKEYYGYSDSLRNICKKQEILQLELEQAEDTLQNKKTERENFSQGKTGLFGGLKAKVFGAATPEQKDEKLKALDETILEWEEKVKGLKENLEKFEQAALDNIEKFHQQKVKDFHDILINYVIITIDRCKKSKAVWSNIKTACDSM